MANEMVIELGEIKQEQREIKQQLHEIKQQLQLVLQIQRDAQTHSRNTLHHFTSLRITSHHGALADVYTKLDAIYIRLALKPACMMR